MTAVPAPRPTDVDPVGALDRADVPAPLEDWWALCDAWGVPRRPDALARAVQAAATDRVTARYLADRRFMERDDQKEPQTRTRIVRSDGGIKW